LYVDSESNQITMLLQKMRKTSERSIFQLSVGRLEK
jgi:hypothetical protein